MRIPSLPQVLFDEFPSDDSTRLCIFTQPKYPVPDLSKSVGKIWLLCTEVTTFFMASFGKELPFELFQLLPDKPTQWMKFEESTVDGLNTPFAIACLPTGSVSGSVMLLIFILDKPDELILYTGSFKECHSVLLSDMLSKHKRKINDLYIDNTMAGSSHFVIDEDNRACDDLKKIIEKYPNHMIHLQMEPLDSLDLLVNLARRHRINVKLSQLQQIFFYRTKYKDLFEFDPQLLPKSATDHNVNFQFKDRPIVYVKSVKTFDLNTYKRLFRVKKIINIRLIASNQGSDPHCHDGLIFVKYTSHAGALTLSQMFDIVQPKRVHPIVIDDELNGNFLAKIPESILNPGSEIVNGSNVSRDLPDVTLGDINPKFRKVRSFLEESTLLADSELEETLDDPGEAVNHTGQVLDEPGENRSIVPVNDEPVAETSNNLSRPPDGDVVTVDSDIDEVIVIDDSVKDDDSNGLDSHSQTSKKRRSDWPEPRANSKISKTNDSNTTPSAYQIDSYDSDCFSTDSNCAFAFPE